MCFSIRFTCFIYAISSFVYDVGRNETAPLFIIIIIIIIIVIIIIIIIIIISSQNHKTAQPANHKACNCHT